MINRISFSVVAAENSKNHYFYLHENPEQTIREQNAMSKLITGKARPKTQNSKLIWESQGNPTTNMEPFEFGESEANMVGDCWAPSPEEWTNTSNSPNSNEAEIEDSPPKYWTSEEVDFEFVHPRLEDDKD